MSFLLRPMIWYKFIGGMVALKGKYRFSSFPQPCLQMHITAFPNGAGHLSALWRTKRVARMLYPTPAGGCLETDRYVPG